MHKNASLPIDVIGVSMSELLLDDVCAWPSHMYVCTSSACVHMRSGVRLTKAQEVKYTTVNSLLMDTLNSRLLPNNGGAFMSQRNSLYTYTLKTPE